MPPACSPTRRRRRTGSSWCPKWWSKRVAELSSLTLAEARDGLRAKKFSAREIADAHLQAIEKAKGLNAYILQTPEKARAMAAESDKRLAKGEARALEGIALGVKDMFATEGVRTTASSKILENFVPGYESSVTANLWRDGAVLLGKTNNDEFAMGSSNETSAFGPVTSPWRRKGSNAPLVPGGSSGGSAAGGWAAGFASAPPAPTPAPRSASRRRLAASSASSRPTAAARAGGSWRSPP